MKQRRGDVLCFGPFAFNRETSVLEREGRIVPLRPLPTRLLALFLESPGELWDRSVLQERLWGDAHLNRERSLNTAVRQLRAALSDSTMGPPEYIQTLRARGYVFVAPVSPGTRPEGPVRARHRWRMRTTIAVMAIVALLIAFGLDQEGAQPFYQPLPTDLAVALQEGRALLASHDSAGLQQSRTLFERVLAHQPAHVGALVGAGETELRLGEPERAKRYAARALEVSDRSVDAHLILANAALESLDFDAARKHHGTALRLAPANPVARLSMAFQASFEGAHDEAARHAAQAVALDHRNNSLPSDLGWIYYRAGRYDDAVKHCKVTVDLLAEHEWARRCLINALVDLGEVGKAAAHIRAFLQQREPALAAQSDRPAQALSDDRVVANYWAWQERRAEGEGDAYGLALALLRQGKRTAALSAAREAMRRRGRDVLFMAHDPRLRPLRNEATFVEDMKRLGFRPAATMGAAETQPGRLRTSRTS